MGCGSSTFEVREDVPGQGKKAGRLGLRDSDINELFAHFKSMDLKNIGLIGIDAIEVANRFSCQVFTEMVFRLMDVENTKKVNFLEYILITWNFCTLSRDNLAEFAFEIFDSEGTGFLSKDDIENMLQVFWGFKRNEKAHHALQQLECNGDGFIAVSEFVSKIRLFPVMFFPVFEMQEILRVRTMGQARWEKLTATRHANFDTMPMFRVLDDLGYKGQYLESSAHLILTSEIASHEFKTRFLTSALLTKENMRNSHSYATRKKSPKMVLPPISHAASTHSEHTHQEHSHSASGGAEHSAHGGHTDHDHAHDHHPKDGHNGHDHGGHGHKVEAGHHGGHGEHGHKGEADHGGHAGHGAHGDNISLCSASSAVGAATSLHKRSQQHKDGKEGTLSHPDHNQHDHNHHDHNGHDHNSHSHHDSRSGKAPPGEHGLSRGHSPMKHSAPSERGLSRGHSTMGPKEGSGGGSSPHKAKDSSPAELRRAQSKIVQVAPSG